jgi:5-formyltetrahydrofolate cyclo-ligase
MTLEELRDALAEYSFFITYTPLAEEPSIPPVLPDDEDVYTVPADAVTDPFDIARQVMQKAAGRKTVVFLPGTGFDATGTRHGRGGGWYDRFLSSVPSEWLRVGICTDAQFSTMPLTRESWDEPVNYVAVCDEGEGFRAYASDTR